MTCVRLRRGRWVVDYLDHAGRRKWKTFAGTEEGHEQAIVEKVRIDRMKRRGIPEEDESITFGEAWEKWLRLKRQGCLPETADAYERAGRVHFFPEWERLPLYRVQRNVIRDLLLTKIEAGFAKATVRHTLLAPLLGFLSWCVNEEKLLTAHPALGLGKTLGLAVKIKPKAMTAPQLAALLERAERTLDPVTYLGILLLSDTGMRIGEAQGATWDDFDLSSTPGSVRVVNQATLAGEHRGLKTEASYGTLELSPRLQAALKVEWTRRKAEALRAGGRLSPFVMCPEFGERPTRRPVKRAREHYARVIAKLGEDVKIPMRVTPHCFRHTVGTILVEQGVNIKSVQEILRHGTLRETERYSKSAKVPAPGAMAEMQKRSTSQPAEVLPMRKRRGVRS